MGQDNGSLSCLNETGPEIDDLRRPGWVRRDHAACLTEPGLPERFLGAVSLIFGPLRRRGARASVRSGPSPCGTVRFLHPNLDL